MIVVLLIMIGGKAITGMANLAADEGTGPASSRRSNVRHASRQEAPTTCDEASSRTVANLPLAFIVFHVLGVGFASFAHREIWYAR